MSFPTTIYDSAKKARETYATQGEIPLGTRLVVPDGRVFRYAQAGASDLKPFKLVGSAVLGPWSTGSCSTLEIMQLATGVNAGATQFKYYYGATGAAVANYFKDGYMVIQSTDTTYVQMCRIGTHAALASCTLLNSANIINIPDGVDLAMVTETGVWPRLIPNLYKSVIVSVDTTLGVGVLGCPVTAVAATYYFWCQTWGPCAVLQTAGSKAIGALAAGFQVFAASGSTGGIACGLTASASGYIPVDTDSGRAYAIGAIGTLMQSAFINTGYATVNLKLAP